MAAPALDNHGMVVGGSNATVAAFGGFSTNAPQTLIVVGVMAGCVNTSIGPTLSIASSGPVGGGLVWTPLSYSTGPGQAGDYIVAQLFFAIANAQVGAGDDFTVTASSAMDTWALAFASFTGAVGEDGNLFANLSSFGSANQLSLSSSAASCTAFVFCGSNSNSNVSLTPVSGGIHLDHAWGAVGVNWAWADTAYQQFSTPQSGAAVGFTNSISRSGITGVMITGAPNVDGSFVSGMGIGGATTITNFLATFQNNDIIVVFACVEGGTPPPTVVSVACGSLSFSLRKRYNLGSGNQNMEVWWALAPTPINQQVTVTWSGSYDASEAMAFAVAGCNIASPWDANASLPKTAAGNPISWTGIGTNNPDDLLLEFISAITSNVGSYVEPSGWLKVADAQGSNSNYMWGHVSAKQVAALQANQSFASTSITTGGPAGVFDALTADPQISVLAGRGSLIARMTGGHATAVGAASFAAHGAFVAAARVKQPVQRGSAMLIGV